MQQPQEIQDEEHEQLVARVAAIDVAKASGMVCTRVPHASAQTRRVTKVWEVPATTNAIIELAGHLAGLGVEKVTVESTSDYVRPWFYLLEAAGLAVQLVNARDVKQVPGRPKTDKLDAVWLAKLTERGMLRPSFIPPAEIRQVRDDTRLRSDLTQERSRHVQRLAKAARGRPDQAVHRGHRHRGRLGSGHAGGPDRRATRPEGACRARQRTDARQARRPGAGVDRPLRRPPRGTGPDAPGPDRLARRPNRPADQPHRGADRRHPRRPATPGPVRAQPRARRWRRHRQGRSRASGAGPAPHA